MNMNETDRKLLDKIGYLRRQNRDLQKYRSMFWVSLVLFAGAASMMMIAISQAATCK